MIFWMLSLLLLAIAVLCILLPLARRSKDTDSESQPLDVYMEQLAALEDKAKLDGANVEDIAQEKAEISRRILRQSRADADDKPLGSGSRPARIAASLAALVLLPAIAIPTYFYTGSPGVRDFPIHARATQNLENTSIDEMVLIAERHLAKNPNDVQGWTVLAGVYGRMNRPDDRARALQELLRLSGPSPELLTDLGEALTVAGGNIVPARARELFDQALQMKPDHSKADFYLAVAEEQEGKFEQALARWDRLATVRTEDANWQAMMSRKRADLRQKLGLASASEGVGPTAEQVQDAANLSQEDRAQMIEGMVAGLAARLEDEPNDLGGWTRLVRSYAVLGKTSEAGEALATAMQIFADQPEALSQLTSQATQLGLEFNATSGETQ